MSNTAMTIFGISFIFLMTSLGSALVLFFKKGIAGKTNTIFLGFASGIMIAASVWSLIIPAIEQSSDWGTWSFIPAAIGFILGGVFLVVIDKVVPHIHNGTREEEGLHVKLKKTTKLFLAVTIHNIPEGLAVGFAFGVASTIGTSAAFISALGLAIGIGIQNFPEGAAVSLPMIAETGKRSKAFMYGVGSGIVEPVFAIIGYFLAAYISVLQPWLLAFAAGAMIFVVAEDLIPDSKLANNSNIGTWSLMVGFVIMMALDVALG